MIGFRSPKYWLIILTIAVGIDIILSLALWADTSTDYFTCLVASTELIGLVFGAYAAFIALQYLIFGLLSWIDSKGKL